jgi:hypothetical protein
VTVHLLAAGPDWGSVPDWLAAVGTLAAFFVALRLLAKELAARREQEEDRRRNQARLVVAWATFKEVSETEVRYSVVMRNGSDEPVYDGLCVVVPSTAVFEWEVGWLILPPHEIKEGDLRLPERYWRPLWEAAIELSFTDAAGRRWTRYPDGRLVELDRPRRRSRKDYMNAWIAGELRDLDY